MKLLKQLTVVFSFCLISYSGLFGQQTFDWAISSGGNGDNFGTSVTSDGAGNSYYCGYFNDEIDLDEAGAGFVLTAPSANTDMFVSKLDPAGNFLWGLHFSSIDRNRAESITIDDNDNIYVTGYFEGTVDFDPSSGTEELTSVTDRDVFILKLDSDGNFLWVKHFGGTGVSQGLDINFSKLDNILVSGIFLGDFIFDPTGQNIPLSAASGLDGFAFRLDQDGNLLDYIQTESTGNAYNYAIDEDYDGNIYIGGFYTGDIDLGGSLQYTATSTDPYVIKYDNTLTAEWVAIGTGTGVGRIRGLRVGEDNDVYFAGRYDGDLDFTATNGVFGVTNIDQEDIYVGSLNALGEMNWLHGIGDTGTDFLLGLEIDNLSNVYMTGYISNTVNFDPAGTFNLTSSGGNDAYIWKLNSAGGFVDAMLYDADFGYDAHVAQNWDMYISGYYSGTHDFDPSGGTFNLTSSGTGRAAYISKFSGNCTAPDAPTLTETANDICPNTTTTIDVTAGNLNDATDWVWYSDSNFTDSIFAGISFTTPSLTDTTTYYVRGEGACVIGTSEITINVGDVTPPVITLSTPITVNTISGSCYYASDSLAMPVVTDFCGVDTVYNDADALLLTGTTNVTWTAIDVNGNMSQEVQVVTVQDIENPTITAPTNVTVAADASCQASGVVLGTPTSNDNCSVASVVNDAPATFPLGTTVVTWTVTDASGNINTDTQDVTVEDQTDPTILALPADIVVNNDPAVCSAIVNWAAPTANDNCAGASIAQTGGLASGSNFPVGVTTIEYTATDAAGNTLVATFTVTVNDNENPTVTAPADITVSADNNCQANPGLGTATSGDNCGVASVSNDAPASFPIGATIVTWTVTDVNGNVNTDTQTITVVDDTNPVINGLPADIVVSNDAGVCDAVVNWVAPTVTDNCAGASISQTGGIVNGGNFPVGVNTVEYTATDGSGNSVVATFTVTVNDNENPTITAPVDVNVSAGSNCTASGVALGAPATGDNCGVASTTNNAPVIYPLGTTTVTWTVTDNAGNIATATQDVIVSDTDGPTVIAPADITVVADASCQGTVASLGTPVTSDNCSVASVTEDGLGTYPLGATTVTWTVTDGSGNVSTDTQTITVVDQTDPVINALPADIVVSNDPGVCLAVVNWTEPTVSDNCTGATISQTSGIANGGNFPVGVTTVVYTATDGSGNAVTASFTVTVNDDEVPTITASADTTIAANNFCTGINIVLDAPTVNDNCGVASVSNDAPVIYNLGTTSVTWTVTDNSGNTATAIQMVTIADSTAPSIIAPSSVSFYVDAACQATIDTLGTPIANDNCAVDTVYNDALAAYGVGDHIITWYAEDAAGNIDSTTQVITVMDTILPSPILSDTTITLDPAGPISLSGADIDAGSTDNCGLQEVVLGQNFFDCKDLGTNIIAVSVIDVNGNIFDTSIVVTVLESGIDLDFDGIDDACDGDVNTTVVEVPSGFTPNGDGINDQFIITALGNYTTINLTVFNRYGNLVYENGQYENDWDGTSSKNGMELPDGTYFYVLELDGGERQNGYVHINRTL